MRQKILVIACYCLLNPANSQADSPHAKVVAREVDSRLEAEIWDEKTKPAPVVSDEVFLRRAMYDVVGHPPSPADIERFVSTTSSEKRYDIVQRLTNDTRYGENWAQYWRDVIMARRSEDRALLTAGTLTEHLTDSFNDNLTWDEIARSFITAEGNVREAGETAIFMAQMGKPEESAAEIARVFLGIQIQCAQCHDHPFDAWTREQFHELAAFFPRVGLRPRQTDGMRSYEVVAVDRTPRRRRGKKNNQNRYIPRPEHYMSDLENPATQGTLMQPVFFVNGNELPLGTNDANRRGKLAEWVTAEDNPWFAKSVVNRMWYELIGVGFYDTVDDIGPERECRAPRTLDYLAAAFVESGHDLKWLVRTIMATDTYQRASRDLDNQSFHFEHTVSRRLRSDQLFNGLLQALSIDQRRLEQRAQQRGGRRRPEVAFSRVFGFDPSMPREEINGSIPQALQLMNGPLIDQLLKVRRRSGLGQLLREANDDGEIVSELYLRALSRSPTRREQAAALTHLRTSEDRPTGCEDLLWALLNSTEFRYLF